VGLQDLSVFLITSEEGHILINTGLADSTTLIRNNIESLGFRLEDVRIILTMQAHWDHTAAMAEIKQITSAEVWATPEDARVLEDGGFSDAHFGGRESFAPVAVDRIIRQDDIITLGDLRITVHEHPGHTEGSSSYTFQVNEQGRDYNVGIINMGTINGGKHLVVEPTYDNVAVDFATTYNRQKKLDVDVWVAAHNSQYNMHDKYQPGQAYDPETFVDPAGYIRAIERLETAYLELIADELDQ
jgi:metallo-beta-lactamase class B